MGAKRPGGKRLGGETTRGGNGLGAKSPRFVCETTTDKSRDTGMRVRAYKYIY